MVRVVIGAPAQSPAGYLTLIGCVDKVARVTVLRSPVVEDGGSPGYRLNLIMIGEGGHDRPVPPHQICQEVIALLTVHIDGVSVVGLRRVELRKVDGALAGVVVYGSG